MLGREGLLCAPAAPLFFADASEVPPSNKAAATAIRADFVMLFLQALGNRTSSYELAHYYQAEQPPRFPIWPIGSPRLR
jgi:hypothetical protein